MTAPRGVSGVRLEVMADPSLPKNGPGRQDNGNLTLTDFDVQIFEPGATAPKLRALGHDTSVIDQNSGLHAIVRTANGWIGGADPAREGIVRGH